MKECFKKEPHNIKVFKQLCQFKDKHFDDFKGAKEAST